MADQARALGMQPSTISSIETGAHPVTADYIERFSKWLELSADDRQALQHAAETMSNVIELRPKEDADGKIVMRFSQSIETLTTAQIKRLKTPIDRGR